VTETCNNFVHGKGTEMKKNFLPLTMLMAMAAAPSYSQSEIGAGGTFTVTPAYATCNTFRGVRLGGHSFQPIIEYARGPLTLGVATNIPLAKENGEYQYWLIENDYYGAYEWAIVPDTFTITPGITLYSYPRVNETFDDTYNLAIEPNLSFGYTVKGIAFSLTLNYDLIFKGPTYEFGIDYSIPLKLIDIELSALIGSYSWPNTSPNYKLKNTGNYWQAGIAMPYKFSENSKLTAGWCYIKGFDNYYKYENDPKYANLDVVSQGIFNIGFSYSF
jgi:hypothetical protein